MSRTKLFLAAGAATLAFAPAADAAPKKADPAPQQSCKKGKQKKGKCGGPVVTGRFTGKGSVSSTQYGTIHYEIRDSICGSDAFPDLKVSADNLDFRLTNYTSPLTCFTRFAGGGEGHPVAGFDSIRGAGQGTLNGVSGASATFQFTDRGEPGRQDLATITILDPSGAVVFTITDRESDLGGNTQAHKSNQ